ncbi:TetR/AcrR family transcriptional regulator [Amycolatopsis sp. H20-H5]|uniref:TetR/AcrR family transcriptional regulator n=1 Tax=Amycolatopsis sp. H20-H5 TaxID=3046309 RepID=UPI002DB5A5F3|nr:TetR/AcrR family transcriptional regulator [Amycolatopsis sp. H20-H5]MEC3973896.1 TetR/AcrR family transcriptional regulator [Amycolatopsis sp. H20-H5]
MTDEARPMRADARRNYERIVTTARAMFAEHGVEVPLDDIAKKACVGPGTLYRHFPTRENLMAAVYREQIDALSQRAFDLLEQLTPGDALDAWVGEQVSWVADRHGLAMTLKASLDAGSETFGWCRGRLNSATATLVDAAQRAGAIRADVTGVDLLRLGHGVGVAAQHASAEDTKRLLAVVLDGLHV